MTAIHPHAGDVFRDRPVAASYVLNGFGKSIGLMQVDELGQLETPILLTNTLSVGTCGTALIRRAMAENPQIGRRGPTVNPVVRLYSEGSLLAEATRSLTQGNIWEAFDVTVAGTQVTAARLSTPIRQTSGGMQSCR